jgi:two-component system sensor histidine kinase YesM
MTYSLLVTVLISLLAFLFYQYNLRQIKALSLQDLDVLSKTMSNQLDEIVRPMQFITEFLLSDNRTLSAITTLTRADRTDPGLSYITLAKKEIQISFSTYCNDVNFYRVSFFSSAGDILSSNVRIHTISDGEGDPGYIPELPLVDAAEGKPVLLVPHLDTWSRRHPKRIFSMIRLIMGNNIPSYIEVQKSYDILESIFNLHYPNSIRVAVINGRGEIFYSQLEPKEQDLLLQTLADNRDPRNQPITRIGNNMAASSYSPYTDTYTVIVQNEGKMKATITAFSMITIGISLLLCLVSVFFIYGLSGRIIAPIGQLITRIEQTNLENLDCDVVIEYTDDELVQLCNSYNHLLKRLNHARRQEEQMSLLHLQAEFDALQAQVNPHFIYNVLNVISHRGVINHDEEICGICEKLASMLRYAAGTSQRLVTIREELDYLEGYLYLLKTRYRDKLEYTIDVEEAVQEQRIPKIVLQQFIENSITHGFKNLSRIMTLSVRGWIEGPYWYMEVRDNGGGFSETGKAALEQRMAEIKSRVGEANLNLDIGGMGLLNIYTRFLILFGDTVIFRLANAAEGAVVTIGMKKSPGTPIRDLRLPEPVAVEG